jgi:hypothetical protein
MGFKFGKIQTMTFQGMRKEIEGHKKSLATNVTRLMRLLLDSNQGPTD